jgi:hypothetical protein
MNHSIIVQDHAEEEEKKMYVVPMLLVDVGVHN